MTARRLELSVYRHVRDVRCNVLRDRLLYGFRVETFGCDRGANVEETVVDGVLRRERRYDE